MSKSELNRWIRQAVEAIGEPLMDDICRMVAGASNGDIREEVWAMIRRGELQRKEDHAAQDWRHSKGRNWSFLEPDPLNTGH